MISIMAVFSGNSLKAQSPDATFDKIASAISGGNAAGLAAFFQANIEITLPGAEGVYSANQAQFVVSDYFTKYPVSSFKINLKGNSSGTFYATGSYASAKGNFDTNIFVKNNGGNFQISTIRFETE